MMSYLTGYTDISIKTLLFINMAYYEQMILPIIDYTSHLFLDFILIRFHILRD